MPLAAAEKLAPKLITAPFAPATMRSVPEIPLSRYRSVPSFAPITT